MTISFFYPFDGPLMHKKLESEQVQDFPSQNPFLSLFMMLSLVREISMYWNENYD